MRQKHTVEHSQAIKEVILAAGVTQKEMSVSGPLASFTPYDRKRKWWIKISNVYMVVKEGLKKAQKYKSS